ncbi:hypothetical protein [Phocaeicola coprophilus]|uniref:hypothetical protein n=1 Tax=Phocaeicola coprophilus TaxID=387090 RepID=UPI00307751B9
MDDKDYIDEIRNYYSSNFVNILSNKSPGLMSYNNDYPDGKANRREARRRELRKRKGRL